AESIPELKVIGVAQVVPNSGAAIDPELGDGAVPGEADDMAGRRLSRMDVGGTAHILPTRFVQLVSGLWFRVHAVEDALSIPGRDLRQVLFEWHWFVARGHVDVKGGDPQGLLIA